MGNEARVALEDGDVSIHSRPLFDEEWLGDKAYSSKAKPSGDDNFGDVKKFKNYKVNIIVGRKDYAIGYLNNRRFKYADKVINVYGTNVTTEEEAKHSILGVDEKK